MRPPIDPQAYESLFAGDRAFQRELTETFIAHATSVSEVIEHAYRHRDVQALQRAAHSLKGAASGIEALELSTRAAQLEAAARSGFEHTSAQLLSGLKSEIARVVEYLRTELTHAPG